MISPVERHRRAHGAFLLLQAMGARVVDGPMFIGCNHGPWRPSDREWDWIWGFHAYLAGDPSHLIAARDRALVALGHKNEPGGEADGASR